MEKSLVCLFFPDGGRVLDDALSKRAIFEVKHAFLHRGMHRKRDIADRCIDGDGSIRSLQELDLTQANRGRSAHLKMGR
jgi:hypothetical protein